MAKKPETLSETRHVRYDSPHWKVLSKYRSRALDIMSSLESHGLTAHVYGSVARGDVSKTSDIDLIILQPVSSFRLEIALEGVLRRELVQATPSTVLKGHIYLPDDIVVTFPLFKFRPREEDFYHWGGLLDIQGVRNELRVLGVDKRLIFIEPTEWGHIESGVIGREHDVARRLGVSPDIAHERVRVLTRRDTVGRTGVYLSRPLRDDESFEEVAKSLRDHDPALRRTIERRLGRQS
ncbi:MAG: nucleotidyltransferase domain-containing protein [Candidatus Thorarchaeota archaeon]|nr:MAG: nucleotidyltransferase [Candidatus Thorarchaeota archaeon]RLI60149.1 MAG: nucleotidyltransferase [Candidatus Thorarchaeota archaeon]